MRDCIAVLLHFRSAAVTLRCLGSLGTEGLAEAVVVDNSDDSGKSLSELRSALKSAAMTIHFIEPGCNLGFAAGVNAAIAFVAAHRADMDVLLINNDATLAPGTARLLRDAVSGNVPIVAAPLIDGPTGLVPARTYYRHISATINPAGPGLRGHVLLGGACLMLHHTLATYPLFDESFFFYGDDIELGYRLHRQGVILKDVERGTVIHEGSGSSGNGSLFYEYHMARAHLLLVPRLGYRPVGRTFLMASRAISLSLRATVRGVRYRSLRAWRGLLMAAVDVSLGRIRKIEPPGSRRT
jgi:N-acetylglucosaminyl-diphospho-decaprenol L-rhamnosyltransferase